MMRPSREGGKLNKIKWAAMLGLALRHVMQQDGNGCANF